MCLHLSPAESAGITAVPSIHDHPALDVSSVPGADSKENESWQITFIAKPRSKGVLQPFFYYSTIQFLTLAEGSAGRSSWKVYKIIT